MKRGVLGVAIMMSTAWAAWGQTPAREGSCVFDVQTVRRIREMAPRIGEARDLVGRGHLERARAQLAFILAKVPEMSEAHFLMAKVHYSASELTEALESMARAETTFEGLGGVMTGMSEERRSELLKRRAEAEMTIYEVGAFTRRLARTSRLPTMQTRLNRAQQARRSIDRELSSASPGGLARPADYAFLHGNILLRLQRPSDAIAQYEKAVDADPGHADAANNLASLCYSGRQYEKALAVLARVESRGGRVNPELKKAIADALGTR